MSTMLDAARLSLKTADELEDQAEGPCPTCQRDAAECLRDELLRTIAEASIAIAEVLCEAEQELPESRVEVNREAVEDFGGEPGPIDPGHFIVNGTRIWRFFV